MEIMNDFRTLQHHTSSLINRAQTSPPDEQSYYLDGYVVLRQCAAESQAILAAHYNTTNLGLQTGHVPETEVQKATLQRCVTMDADVMPLTGAELYLTQQHADFRPTRFTFGLPQPCDGSRCGSNIYVVRSRMAGTSKICKELINICVRSVKSHLQSLLGRSSTWKTYRLRQ